MEMGRLRSDEAEKPSLEGGRNVTLAEYSFFMITNASTAPAVQAIKKLTNNNHRNLYRYAKNTTKTLLSIKKAPSLNVCSKSAII